MERPEQKQKVGVREHIPVRAKAYSETMLIELKLQP